MSKIKAEIIADSITKNGNRLTTFLLTYPRIIHAELLTHRMFSRNSASSRAIPAQKMLDAVNSNPFIPLAWQKAHKGMQGTEYFTDPDEIKVLEDSWIHVKDKAVEMARKLTSLEVTKQLVNRLLEPFMWHTVIVTTSQEGLENFFRLRCPRYFGHFSWKEFILNFDGEDPSSFEEYSLLERLDINDSEAEIHLSLLAEEMYDAYHNNIPKALEYGDWHIPFIDKIDNAALLEYSQKDVYSHLLNQIEVSVAMCARVSYTAIGDAKEIDFDSLIALTQRLKLMKHASPFEHCAIAKDTDEYFDNLKGFRSYRHLLEL